MPLRFLALACAALISCTAVGSPSRPAETMPAGDASVAQGEVAANVSPDLAEVAADPSGRFDGSAGTALLGERRRRLQAGDAANVARLNAGLASEAFARAARVTSRWLDHRDSGTGLFPKDLRPEGRVWTYGDAGADLFPFVTLATWMLVADRYPEMLATLASERAASPQFPRDIDLDTGAPLPRDAEEEMLAAVEYAKDGLVPLAELLGPDPWLGRLREVTDQILARSTVPTARGPIPANSAEINGSVLQVLARLHWATGNPRYREMGHRIAAAYLDDALPTTEYLPPHRWDFIANDPIGPRRFFLGDHGNEIVSGLVEWHRIELATRAPGVERHRLGIRKMLDRLLVKGRASNGLWHAQIDVPSGKVRDKQLTDNWGYLGQAYLHQAQLERSAPGGDHAIADRLEGEIIATLQGVSGMRDYDWQAGEMDGYADSLEGALYLLRYLDVPDASDWLHDQMAVLYGFQKPDGRVTDDNIDGNFLRTVLLYGLALTQGIRVEPWSEAVALGAARDGDCVQVYLQAQTPWAGRLVFDTRRHQAHLGLPADYPRLNQWPEWFPVDLKRTYTVADPAGARSIPGHELTLGLEVSLQPGRSSAFRVCPR